MASGYTGAPNERVCWRRDGLVSCTRELYHASASMSSRQEGYDGWSYRILGGRKNRFDDEKEVLWSESWTAVAALSSGCKPADKGGESGEVPGPGAATTDRTGGLNKVQYGYLASVPGVNQEFRQVPSQGPGARPKDMYHRVANSPVGKPVDKGARVRCMGYVESEADDPASSPNGRIGQSVRAVTNGRRRIGQATEMPDSDATATGGSGPMSGQGESPHQGWAIGR